MSVEDYNSARNVSSPTTGVGGEPTKPDLGAKRIDFIDITEKLREHGDQPLVMLTSSFLQAKDNLGRFDDYALVLRRCVDREGVEISTTLEIRSEILRKTLKECLADYASLTLEAIPILIRKPYDALFHYRKELRGYATADERTAEEKPHMKLLLDFMNRNIAASERAYEQLVPQNLITFDLLWALFRVDEIIIQTTDHYTQAYRVKSSKTYLLNNEIVFEISAWNWGYNGSRFGPSPDVIIIEHFQGQRKVTDLHVYPLYILSPKSQQDFKNDFIQRGRQWKSLGEVTYGEYEGKLLKPMSGETLNLIAGPMWVNPPDEKVERMSDLILNQVRRFYIYITFFVSG
jgi:hypothetical protein